MNEKIPFYPADILLPKVEDYTAWSVIACDQYTSQPDYWADVRKIVGDKPSALNLVLPELCLNDDNVEDYIKNINNTMSVYLKDVLREHKNSFIYVERKLRNGSIRQGIIGMVDLEHYKFEPGNNAMIRATEGTVAERIPPRVRVRENALLELPHILLLIDDKENYVFSSIEKGEIAYDFELMKESGHLTAWFVKDNDKINSAFEKLKDSTSDTNGTMLFAVGDGNHSLATAKACWENIKKTQKIDCYHPARYALVEMGNIHEESLLFEPIHRIVFNCKSDDVLNKLNEYCGISKEYGEGKQVVYSVIKGKVEKLYMERPTSNLPVGTLQNFLDIYTKANGCEVDYIHGDNVVKDLSLQENTIGFLVPSIDKSDLFATVIKDGILPRKTFSMGEAYDKRFYVEARRISPEEK